MYLRFVVSAQDARTGYAQGLLTAAYALLRWDALADADAAALREHLAWFETHVPSPTKFARKRNVSHRNTHGLSWVRSDARAVVTRLHALARFIERYGYVVDVMRSARPGYVVYEDDLQVVAEPFNGEARRGRKS